MNKLSKEATEIDKLINDTKLNINYQDENGAAPLDWAVWYKMIDTVEKLIEKGANPNLPSEFHRNPLHLALRNGNIEMAWMLIDKGADCDLQDKDGWTALNYLNGSYKKELEAAIKRRK